MLYFVIFQEEGFWIAQGLQHSLVVHGETLRELRVNIEDLFGAYEADAVALQTLNALPKADPEFWQKFIKANDAGNTLESGCEAEELAETYYLRRAA